MSPPSPGQALVLSGGAARGAYEAGVLRYLYTELPRHLGYVPWPSVVSGTSVGSLNGVHAVTRLTEGVLTVSEVWRKITFDSVFRLRAPDVLQALVASFREQAGPFALFDARPLHALIVDLYPRRALREAIDRDPTRAFVVSATELDTGVNSLFLDASNPAAHIDPGPGSRVLRVRMAPRHILASAAMPFLFPPVPIQGSDHVDGGLRQNTPVRPVLGLGVDKILVVGLRRDDATASVRTHVTPTLTFLAGKTLNAVMLDPVERDLHDLEQRNEFLAWAARRYGQGFLEAARTELGRVPTRLLHLKPSVDLGAVAHEVYQRWNASSTTAAVRALLALVRDRANTSESDLLSYLFFDRAFTGALEDLGFEDARRREEELAAFYGSAAAER